MATPNGGNPQHRLTTNMEWLGEHDKEPKTLTWHPDSTDPSLIMNSWDALEPSKRPHHTGSTVDVQY